MSNDYYERKAELEPFTTARSDDVRNELDAVQSGFEKLPKPRQDGTIGFLTPFTIVAPTNPNEPATNAQITTEKSKNAEQDLRLDGVESALVGLGPVDGRFTTLRYVAAAGQTQIVLPSQFQSLAYVHKNGARLYQTVGFDYDVALKTITFTNPLELSDEVLVDVGMVPDAVLVDLIALQDDVNDKHLLVNTMHENVQSMQAEVSQQHDQVNEWQQAVNLAKNATIQAKDDTNQVATDFNKLNLGAHAVEPTTDNNGEPLTDGAWYYNTTTHLSYVRTQGVFVVTNLSSYTTVFQDSPNGAMELPFGADSGRPAGQDKPWLRARLSDGKAEYFNPVTKKIGPVGGGGVPVPITVTDQVYVAGKDENIRVDVSDDVSRTVTIEPGWNVGDFVYASLGGWTGNPSVTVTLDPDDSYSWDYADIPNGEPFVIEGNQFVAIQVVAENTLSISFAKGEYDDIQEPEVVLFEQARGSSNGDNEVVLSKDARNFKQLKIYATWSSNGTAAGRRTKVTIVDVSEILQENTDFTFLELFRVSVANTGTAAANMSIGRLRADGLSFAVQTSNDTWTSEGVYKVIGVR